MRCDPKWYVLKKNMCGLVWSSGPWLWLQLVVPRGETLAVEMEITLEDGKAALCAGLPPFEVDIGEK